MEPPAQPGGIPPEPADRGLIAESRTFTEVELALHLTH
jgi:hypothetical protein